MKFEGIDVGKLQIGRTYTRHDLAIDFISDRPKTFKILGFERGTMYAGRRPCITIKAQCVETKEIFNFSKPIRHASIPIPSAKPTINKSRFPND